MTGEELAAQAKIWKQELQREVIPHYRSENRERGRLAFDRWKERVRETLEKTAPVEAERFIRTTRHLVLIARRDESSYEEFMREDGNNCIAFLDELIDASIKGRVQFSEKIGDRADSSIQASIPMTSDHSKRLDALNMLQTIKNNLDRKAERQVRVRIWVYFSFIAVFWVVLACSTWLFGWDVMEPLTYFLGGFVTLIGYIYFALTLHEPSPISIYHQIVARKKIKLYQEIGFDPEEHNQLLQSEHTTK